MNEARFAEHLLGHLQPVLTPHKVELKRSLLYELSFDHKGIVAMGVDPDSGEPIRGGGRGFEQDILVFDQVADGQTSVVPRIVAELKYGGITTHDVIVYSEKADRIRRVYPYVRYGLVIGGFEHIPGRVLRLGQRFDFVASISHGLPKTQIARLCEVMHEEAAASVTLTNMFFGGGHPTLIRKKLVIDI
jgi:hypothetical protein